MKRIHWPDQIFNFIGIITGVSLAFVINNASSNAEREEELQQIVRSLIDELEFDINVYEKYQIKNNNDQSLLIDSIMLQLDRGNLKSIADLKRAFNSTSYTPQSVTFNSISSSGKLDLIKDFELRKIIVMYHQILVTEGRFQGRRQIDFFNEYILPFAIDETDMVSPEVDKLPLRRLKNLLYMYKSIIDNKVEQYRNITAKAKELKSSLEAMLED